MKVLNANETKLVGEWIADSNLVSADETCQRIDWLINHALEIVAEGNWFALYRDPSDGRYWEVYYPQSHMYGGGPGGPPSLINISFEDARKRYEIE